MRHQGSPGRQILNHCTTREVPFGAFLGSPSARPSGSSLMTSASVLCREESLDRGANGQAVCRVAGLDSLILFNYFFFN